MKKLIGIVAFGAALMGSSAFAADMAVHYRHRHAHHGYGWYDFSYFHNYGPVEFYPDGLYAVPDRVFHPVGQQPYAYYDGHRPFCRQSAPTYVGQDGRRHPCN